jgi:hypothetical protein
MLALEVPRVPEAPSVPEVPPSSGVPAVTEVSLVLQVPREPGVPLEPGVPGLISASNAASLARRVGGRAFLDTGDLPAAQLGKDRPVVLVGFPTWVVGRHRLAPRRCLA